jgi:hypothetical protein
MNDEIYAGDGGIQFREVGIAWNNTMESGSNGLKEGTIFRQVCRRGGEYGVIKAVTGSVDSYGLDVDGGERLPLLCCT